MPKLSLSNNSSGTIQLIFVGDRIIIIFDTYD